MNVAICYSGQIRNFKECFETHTKHIINKNDCKFYIFAHFWNDNSLIGKSYWNQFPERDSYKKENILDFLDINADCYLIEKPIDFSLNLIPDPRFPHPIQNTLSMFYSMSMANKLKNNFSSMHNIKFDWVLRMRTDLFFIDDLNLSSLHNSNLYVNNQYIHMDYAINDLFSFSSDENMNIYFSTFDKIPKLVDFGCAINPECLLGFNLQQNRVKLSRINLQNFKYKLFRDL